jgi:hypothetical protein
VSPARFLLLFTPVLSLVISGTRAAPARAAGDDAAERFARGVRRFNEGDTAGALAEFLRSHELAPAPLVLYNIGVVQAQLGRPVESASALEKVLKAPGSLAPDKLERARQLHDEQAARIGHLLITTSAAAQIEIDNVEVGRTPLAAPIALAGGVRLLSVIAPGHEPVRRQIELAAGQTLTLDVPLTPIEAALAQINIESPLPGADVVLDGKVVGRTPLHGSLAVTPGPHNLSLRRAGYREERSEVALAGGASQTVSFALTEAPDSADLGIVALLVSERDATVIVDGRPRPDYREGLRLAAGVHHVSVMRTGFFPVDRDLTSQPATLRTVRITLEPTEETRVAHVDRASGQRRWAWTTIAAGAVIAGGSAFLFARNRGELRDAHAEIDEVRPMLAAGGQCSAMFETNDRCQGLVTHANDRLDRAEHTEQGTLIGLGVGAGVLLTGVVLRVLADDPAKYDFTRPRDEKESGFQVLAAVQAGGALVGVGGTF